MPESTAARGRIRAVLHNVVEAEARNAAPAAAGGAAEATDEQLMAGLAAGDILALEALYDRYVALVFSVGLRVLGDRQLAEDVVQDVFLRLWRRPLSYDAARGRFVSWLLSVARNRAIDERRRMARRTRLEEPGDGTAPEVPGPARFYDPHLEAVLAEERRAVREAMTRLPPAQREVIELAYFAGLTQVQIAAQTGEPLGTVKTRTRLGMRKLRDSLSELLGEART